MRWFAFALPFFAAALLVAPSEAEASACNPSSGTFGGAPHHNRGQISCNQPRSTSVGGDSWNCVGKTFLDNDVYGLCPGSPNEQGPEDIWEFTCPPGGDIQFELRNAGCNTNLYVVGPRDCDANIACAGDSTLGGGGVDAYPASASDRFICDPGSIYYIAVEVNDYNAAGWIDSLNIFSSWDCHCDDSFGYTLTAKCYERPLPGYDRNHPELIGACDDGFDNDIDSLRDCEDPDCPGPCKEICDDGRDNDFDGKTDCEDEDCIFFNACCDKDGDYFRAVDGICGGDDCNDDPTHDGFFFNPGAEELPGDKQDQNCDGLELCFTDADLDHYGTLLLQEETNVSCIGSGYSDRSDDCNDSDPATHPDAVEILADGIDENCDAKEDCYLDQDGDGFGSNTVVSSSNLTCVGGGVAKVGGDCNDLDRFIFPGAVEFPVDGKDSNCDGSELCFEDRDGDAYGRTTTKLTTSITCVGPGVSINSADCNDEPSLNGAAIYPFATELPADGIDQNCDGSEDCWRDADSDTFGNNFGQKQPSGTFTCVGSGISPNSSDCNDGNNTIFPGAPDTPGDGIDQNCDGLQDCFRDADGDTYGGSTYVSSAVPNCAAPGISNRSGDCDDNNRAVNPGATEIPLDGVDLNCDGFEACYTDSDGDLYGRDTLTNSTSFTCTAPGVSNNKTDCNDVPPLGASIHPGATEVLNNGIDENCDGLEQCYKDNDSDGHGVNTLILSTSTTCNGFGASNNTDDCNDADPRVYPGATEVTADNKDEDCDGFEMCYRDVDVDHFGIPSTVPSVSITCTTSGVANNPNDCDDTNAAVYPGAPNGPLGGVDYDCSGTALCYQDTDGDGYGRNVQVPSGGSATCTTPGMSPNASDCDDNNAAIHPNTTELLNDHVDQDCDGFELCYKDQDNDGYGGLNTLLSPDLQCNALGVSANNQDCNDNPAANGAAIYPNAPEIPVDGVDESCNGLEDCYIDLDVDKYGGTTKYPSADLTCVGGNGYTNNKDDCDDTTALRNPGRAEIPVNGFDENCDNADDCWQDLDGDHYGSSIQVASPSGLLCNATGVAQIAGDCYDVPPNGALIYPGAPETPGDGIDSNCDLKDKCYVDTDRDGFGGTTTVESTNLLCQTPGLSLLGTDCSDNDATVNPGVAETPANSKDQNCDGKEDCYLDQDRDTYGSTSIVQSATLNCTAAGTSARNDDCYDLPPEGAGIHPGAAEITGNGLDEDCDGKENCWLDGDHDTYGRPVAGLTAVTDCSAVGYSKRSDDCNDQNLNVHPNAVETPVNGTDENCDGKEDCYRDFDGDTYGTTTVVQSTSLTCQGIGVSTRSDDCLDVLPGGDAVHPGAVEIFGNGIDENCDGGETCFVDQDRDGFGGTGTINTPNFSCTGAGAAAKGGDCNDSVATVNPDANEVPANGVDEDCNGTDACYVDQDQDSFGSGAVTAGNDLDCLDQGEASNRTDCVDFGSVLAVNAHDINPAAIEVCNSVDDDCDTLIDDADPNLASQSVWYLDVDHDLWGVSTGAVAKCNSPGPGYVKQTGDCNDANGAINPGMPEICDPLNVDENCNGLADDDFNAAIGTIDATNPHAFYPDLDRDLYGDMTATPTPACDPVAGKVEDHTDCNDRSAAAHPGLTEVPYDGLDNDCNLATRDDDLDGDGFNHNVDCNDVPGIGILINPSASELTGFTGVDDDCDGKIDDGTIYADDDNDGYAEVGGDCDDTNAVAHPGAIETANGKDDDCDGKVDEDTVRSDDDGDGWSETTGIGDCNDADPRVSPGATEIMGNGIDDDCDGSVDGGTYDPDGDGYTEAGGDCNEGISTIFPGAPETANGIDDDCDGTTDEGTSNYDDDGDGFSEANGDCNDFNNQIYPGQSETPDGFPNHIDDNCNGQVDENTDAFDNDGDGFSIYEGDCEGDANPNVHPGADEVANNGLDDDCDGFTDETEADKDGDGFLSVEAGCVEVDSNCDCNDDDGWTNPDAQDICDGVDNDCNGVIDGNSAEGELCTDKLVPPPKVCGCDDSSNGAGRLFLLPAGLLLISLRRRQRAVATR